jgi:ribulose 1,5-bisphosphate synthetase/thiazole synthase
VTHVVQRKSGTKLLTSSGKVDGEKPMNADRAERLTVGNTKAILQAVYAAGLIPERL